MDSDALRTRLDKRFFRAARSALGQDVLPGLRLPAILRESMIKAASLCGGALADEVVEYYTESMPRMLIAQRIEKDAPAASLLSHPLCLSSLPRLREALSGICAALTGAGLDPRALLGESDGDALVARRPTLIDLHGYTLFGTGLPLLGAFPAELELCQSDLCAGASPNRTIDQTIDLRLSGNLVHELCHGLQREVDSLHAPWIVIEAAAIHLGKSARPAHIFPDEPGEAVPGVSLFVLVGEGLARLFGEDRLWRVSLGDPLVEMFGPRVAAALSAAGWQEFLHRRRPPFVADALPAMEWLKLADAARGTTELDPILDLALAGEIVGLPDLLSCAKRLKWQALPWYSEPPSARDRAMVEVGISALFQVNCLAPTYQTHPAEVPGGRIFLDVEECVLLCETRPEGVFAEPGRWLFPPSLSRALHERGARRVRIVNALRKDRRAIARSLLALALDSGPLDAEVELAWTSSKA